MTAEENDQPTRSMPENVLGCPDAEQPQCDAGQTPPEEIEHGESDHEPGYGHGV